MASRASTHFHEAFSHFLERELALSCLTCPASGWAWLASDLSPAGTHWAQVLPLESFLTVTFFLICSLLVSC